MFRIIAFAAIASATLASTATAQLVINEVDYDQAGVDTAEFVEIRNNSSCPVDLTYFALLFLNGATNAEYSGINLAPGGILQPGQYLVVSAPSVVVPSSAIQLPLPSSENAIQNGAPDAIAIINIIEHVLVDSISYEGAMTSVNILGFVGPVSLVAGTPLPASIADSNTFPASLVRTPDASDTQNDATDWALSLVITPGFGNDGTSFPLIPCCGSSDYNADGDYGTDADIEAFFACLGGDCCPTCFSGASDFNGDGDYGTDADIEAFFRVLSGGSC